MVTETRQFPWWARVLVYAVAGWCVELFFTAIASLVIGDPKLTGQSYLWMLPVWGFGILLLEKLSDLLNRYDVNLRVRIIFFMLVAFSIEYVSGFVISFIVGVVPWDYSRSEWNVHEYVRMDYAPFWAVAGVFLEPFIEFVRRIEIRNKTPLSAMDSIPDYESGDKGSSLIS